MPGTTPVYGFPYPEPTDLVADYPALGQQLAEDIEDVLPTIGGLAPATPTSIANSGGTATLSGNTVTFSGVSSVSLNGCFTGDYDNYRVLAVFTVTTAAGLNMRLRAGGSDNTSSTYQNQVITANGTSVSAERASSTTWAVATGDTSASTLSMDLMDPFRAVFSVFSSLNLYNNTATGTILRTYVGEHATSSSFDGFTLFPDTGTISGTVTVLGYRK